MENILVSNEERENAPFVMFGNEFKIKVADLDKIIKDVRLKRSKDNQSMVIEVKAIKTYRHKEINKVIKFAKDPATGIHYGVIIGTYDDGNAKWRGIYLTDFNRFDLNKDIEAKMFAILRMHPCMKGCPFDIAEPEFEIIDPDQIAKEKIRRAIDVKNALNLITTMKNTEVLPLARYIGVSVLDGATSKIVKSVLMDYIMDKPREFLEKYNEPLRRTYELVATARHVGIVKFDSEKGYTLGSLPLGFSITEAVRIIEKDGSIAARIQNKMKQVNKSMLLPSDITAFEDDDVPADTNATK